MEKPVRRMSQLPDDCEDEIRLSVPLEFRRGSLRNDERKSINSAIQNLKRISALTDRDDWSNLKVLDYGCGVKFTQALIQYDVDVEAFVGMDVYKGLIDYLSRNVTNPGFRFYHIDAQNEMYNRRGKRLKEETKLPGDIRCYDLITLQSVFTHFAPDDFLALLKVFRQHVSDSSRLFFTCFIDNSMATDFEDRVPDKPLLKAYYREDFVRKMLQESGWDVLLFNPPSHAMQHQCVCRADY